MVPPFLVAFLLASALDTLGLVPASWHGPLTAAGVFGITAALTGIGLSTRADVLRRAGARPLLLGALLWVAVAVSGLALQAATGTL